MALTIGRFASEPSRIAGERLMQRRHGCHAFVRLLLEETGARTEARTFNALVRPR